MTNQEFFERWAETHTLQVISFWWRDSKGEGECRLLNQTYNQALVKAMEQGYREPKWYKPWTWANGVVTVG
jgi:hypothetical protein